MARRTKLVVALTAAATALATMAGVGDASAATVIKLQNGYSLKCLIPDGILGGDGVHIVQTTCDGDGYEGWHWSGDTLVNQGTGRCLTVYGASKEDGAIITQWTCNGSGAQDWTDTLVHAPLGDAVTLKNQNSGKCLVIKGASKDDDAQATQWTCNSADLAYAWYR